MLYLMKIRVPKDDPGRNREDQWQEQEAVVGPRELGMASLQSLLVLATFWGLVWVSL